MPDGSSPSRNNGINTKITAVKAADTIISGPVGCERLVNQKYRHKNRGERGYGDDRRRHMERTPRRHMSHQFAAEKGARHGGDVEPQPLLNDKAVAAVQPLTVFDKQRAA